MRPATNSRNVLECAGKRRVDGAFEAGRAAKNSHAKTLRLGKMKPRCQTNEGKRLRERLGNRARANGNLH